MAVAEGKKIQAQSIKEMKFIQDQNGTVGKNIERQRKSMKYDASVLN